MKANDLRQKSRSELDKELQDSLREQFNLRMQKSTGQLKDTSKIAKVRKNIARVKTVMKEMEGVSNG